MRRIFTAASSRTVGVKNHRQVKARLDSRGVHTMDVSTNSKNRHGEFTRITTMTYIDEAYLYRCIFQSLLRFKNPRGRKETTRFWGRRYNRHPYNLQKQTWWVHHDESHDLHRWIESLSLHLPEQVVLKNPRQVKARLDSGGVISSDASTSSNNQYGEFTLTQIMTIIDESNIFHCIFQRSLG